MIKTVSGPTGAVKWGYRSVAALGAWRYEAGTTEGTITAQLQHVDEFGLTQGPLVVSVSVGISTWRWPVLSVRRDGSDVTIAVGPLEA